MNALRTSVDKGNGDVDVARLAIHFRVEEALEY